MDIRHEFDEESRGKRSPFWIDKLQPIQVAAFDLEDYRACRRELTSNEWVDLLLRSMKLEPSHFDRRLKMLFLVRLIPLCENNYNLMELGPRGAGKSYAYQELSPYVILLTGPTTVPNHFYNMTSGKMGLVGLWDAVGFDEVADHHFSFGAHLNARDVKAVRKSVAGLLKIVYPDGQCSKDGLAELLEVALEGRRRVKEQLKKNGIFRIPPDLVFVYRQGNIGETIRWGARRGRKKPHFDRPPGARFCLCGFCGRPRESGFISN